jgi:tetratricopeptide (TPR) repeat protein
MWRMESEQPEKQNFEMPAAEQDEDYLADTKPRRVRPAQEQPEESPVQTAPEALSPPEAMSAANEAVPVGDDLEQTAATPVMPSVESLAEESFAALPSPDNAVLPGGYEETFAAPVWPGPASEPYPSPAPEAVFIAPVAAGAPENALPGATAGAPVDAPAGAPGSPPVSSKPAARPGSKKKGAAARPGRKARKKSDFTWLLLPILGIVALFVVGLLSAFGGYASGIDLRRDAASTLVAGQADEQFQLGLDDLAQGNYFRARQRFEYVIQVNPNYPGATEKLAEALMFLNATATATLQSTATLTPTPDMRDQEELFNQAQQALLNSQWEQAIEGLLALRQKDETYRPVEIDGMLFIALRNSGKEKILKADLESGIYDLNLASQFGPLDSEAKGLQSWTELYITGASFWDLDWAQAVNYFQQVAPQMPNLVDGSGMTANDRLRVALFEYGNNLAQQGKACQAVSMYQQSLAIAPDTDVNQALERAAGACSTGGPVVEGTPKPNKKKTPAPGAP